MRKKEEEIVEEDIKKIILCFGTFFSILIEYGVAELSSKSWAPAGNEKGDTENTINERAIFVDLNRIVDPLYLKNEKRPDNVRGIRELTNRFKSCKQNDTHKTGKREKLPINDNDKLNECWGLDNSNTSVLNRMHDFINKFINTSKKEQLVQFLIWWICNSKNVEQNTVFYIYNERQKTATKDTIRGIENVDLPAFILGIFRFTVENMSSNNSKEASECYTDWWPQDKNSGALRPMKTDKIEQMKVVKKHPSQIITQKIIITCEKRDESVDGTSSNTDVVATQKTIKNNTLTTNQQLVHQQNENVNNDTKLSNCSNNELNNCNDRMLGSAEQPNILKSNDIAHTKILSVPFLKNPLFTGRLVYLKAICKEFNKESNGILCFTLSGFGGIGKTQIALEYVYNYCDNYQTVCWINCNSHKSITQSFERFFEYINERTERDVRKQFAEWIEKHTSWLLILDNVLEEVSIQDFFPIKGKGHIIITTRSVPKNLRNGQFKEVHVMKPSEAIKLLENWTHLDDIEGAYKIAFRLSCFPLALEQAGIYISGLQIDYQKYLNDSNKSILVALNNDQKPEDYNYTVLTVCQMTVNKLTPEAKKLLYCFVFMAHNNIELGWLIKHAHKIKDEQTRFKEHAELLAVVGKSSAPYTITSFNDDLISILTGDSLNLLVKQLLECSLVFRKKDSTFSFSMLGLIQKVIIESNIAESSFLLSVYELIKAINDNLDNLNQVFDVYYHWSSILEKCNTKDKEPYSVVEINYQFNEPKTSPYYNFTEKDFKSLILNILNLLQHEQKLTIITSKKSTNGIYPPVNIIELIFRGYSFLAQLYMIHERYVVSETYFCKTHKLAQYYFGGTTEYTNLGENAFITIREGLRCARANLLLGRNEIAKKCYNRAKYILDHLKEDYTQRRNSALYHYYLLWREFSIKDLEKDAYDSGGWEIEGDLLGEDNEIVQDQDIEQYEKNLQHYTICSEYDLDDKY